MATLASGTGPEECLVAGHYQPMADGHALHVARTKWSSAVGIRRHLKAISGKPCWPCGLRGTGPSRFSSALWKARKAGWATSL